MGEIVQAEKEQLASYEDVMTISKRLIMKNKQTCEVMHKIVEPHAVIKKLIFPCPKKNQQSAGRSGGAALFTGVLK